MTSVSRRKEPATQRPCGFPTEAGGRAAFPELSWAAAAAEAEASGRTVRFRLRGIPWEVTPGGLSNPARLELGPCPRCGAPVLYDAWAGEEVVRERGTGSGRRGHDCGPGLPRDERGGERWGS